MSCVRWCISSVTALCRVVYQEHHRSVQGGALEALLFCVTLCIRSVAAQYGDDVVEPSLFCVGWCIRNITGLYVGMLERRWSVCRCSEVGCAIGA